MINAFWEPVRFHIQEGKGWKRIVDTSRHCIEEELLTSANYEVSPRSIVVLEHKPVEVTR
jgi:hypothetical protein